MESEREVEHLCGNCGAAEKGVRVLIRVNPPFDLAKSGMRMGGGPKQFGIDSDRVPALIRQMSGDPRLQFKGIHIFAGSQNLNAGAVLETFEKILAYAAELRESTATRMEVLNMGGGFGIPYFATDPKLELDVVGAGLRSLLDRFRARLPDTQFHIELGRYIVGECGLYVAEVLYRKVSRGEVSCLFRRIDG